MNKKATTVFSFFFLVWFNTLHAKKLNVDSLRIIWKNTSKPDTVQLNALYLISQTFINSNPDSTIFYSDYLIAISERKKLNLYLGRAYHSKGWAFYRKGDSHKAYLFLSKSISVFESMHNDLGLANSYNSIAAVFDTQKDSLKEREYHKKALGLYEKLNDKRGIATVLSNMTKEPGEAHAMDRLTRCLQLYKEIGDKSGIAVTLFKIAQERLVTDSGNNIPEEFFQCLKTFDELNNTIWTSYINSAIAELYVEKGDYKTAIDYSKKGYNIAIANDLSKEKMDNLIVLITASQKLNNYKEAFKYYSAYVSERDSVNNIATNNTIIKQEMNYEFDKQKALDKKEQEKKMAIVAEQGKRQKVIIFSVGFGLFLFIVFAAILSSRLRITRKQKNIIDIQKKSTEKQKEIIEEKQKEIIESIKYAMRIQQAHLPSDQYIEKTLKRLKTK
ncbi:MAG: tetratricopeptide repeat protein [Bacteroidota bacterium]|nr:tetratricopeptide repeat protein [Bacteroidota bacterium]